MRISSLTLLSFLLLAAQVLSEKVKNGAKNTEGSAPSGDPSVSLGKAHDKQRSRTSKSMPSGKFVTKNQATCRWAVAEQESAVTLKVECTHTDQEFSCVFAGNPAGCLKNNKEKDYWKQIGRVLHKQKDICGNPKGILKTRVCRKKFPDSNLKLVNSTLLGNMKPREPIQENKELSKVREDTSSSPPGTQTTAIEGPECLEDPDVANQRKTALEFCGETWSSFCAFFLNMFQSTTC